MSGLRGTALRGALKPITARLLAAAVAVSVGVPAAHAGSYSNEHYGYSVEYPSDLLIPEREADNGDGRHFHARHGTATMSVWGSFNGEEETPADIERDYSDRCIGAVPYRVVKPNLVAFSCRTKGGRTLYHKTLVHHDVLTTIEFDYPSAEHAIWDPVVAKVSGSLRAATECTSVQGIDADAAKCGRKGER